MMSLEEAIAYCGNAIAEQLSCGATRCAEDYTQLKEWLQELQNRRYEEEQAEWTANEGIHTTTALRDHVEPRTLVADVFTYPDTHTVEFNFSVQDACVNESKSAGIFSRITRAIKVLLGKPVYYAEVITSDKDEVRSFASDLVEAISRSE